MNNQILPNPTAQRIGFHSKTVASKRWHRLGITCLLAITTISLIPGCMSYKERMEQVRLAQQIEIERQEAEARQRREAEERRQQEAYAQWFNSLNREQQMVITVEKEKSKRVQEQAQGEVLRSIIDGVSNVMSQ